MNPRRVHELMKAHFPEVDLAAQTWVNVLESDGRLRREVLGALIDKFVGADDLLVEVNRKRGDFLPREDVISYVQKNVSQGQIKITDRGFRGYVLVGANGVATGWSSSRS